MPNRHGSTALGSPSSTLLHSVAEFGAPGRYPVLDAGCGFGRNAVALSLLGYDVVCADKDSGRLSKLARLGPEHVASRAQSAGATGELHPVCVDLDPRKWPFCEGCFCAVICVHFLNTELLKPLSLSLARNGCLYVETVGGQGENYLELPKTGELRDLLSKDFHLLFYRERAVGPAGFDAVSVKLLARKNRGPSKPFHNRRVYGHKARSGT